MTYSDDWMLRSEVNGVLIFYIPTGIVYVVAGDLFGPTIGSSGTRNRTKSESALGKKTQNAKCPLRLDFNSHESGLENFTLLRFYKKLVFENEWREIILHTRDAFLT